jgi:C4-dicarboxylate-specific signal transduction histidine kinase
VISGGTKQVMHDFGEYLRAYWVYVFTSLGTIAKWHGVDTGIEDRKRVQEDLRRSEAFLAKGQEASLTMSLGALAASIAHEVNQPLAGIITNAGTCLRMLGADPPNVEGARETARRTMRDGQRASDVIARLRSLFSNKAPTAEIVDLVAATREVLALVAGDLLRNRVILRTAFGNAPLLVDGDRVQLQQVILNLVRNATDAMRGVHDRPRSLEIRAEPQGNKARLIVKDAGVGFEPDSAEKLFDAFYTTKSDGMGIGLSLSRSIIESHDGTLWAEPNHGSGATFSFSVPRKCTVTSHQARQKTGERSGG